MRSQMFITRPMSWSIRSVVVPASAIRRSRWPSSSLSFVSRPAAGSSRQRSRGSIAIARATPTSLRCPWVRSAGIASAIEPRSSRSSARSAAALSPRAPSDQLGGEREERRALGGHGEVLAHGEVVEQLGALPGAREPAPRPRVRRQPREIAPVELDAARVADEAGDRVDERRLAGAVRPDQADELALLDVDVDVVDGAHAAEADGQAGGGQDGAHDALAGSDSARSTLRFSRA